MAATARVDETVRRWGATHRGVWWLSAITAVALVLRLYAIGSKSLWVDESFSLWISSQSLGDLLANTLRTDEHPPLYYLLLHFWLGPDSTEVGLRTFSALWGVATVPVMYLVGREVGGTRPAVVVAALQAISPLHVWYGQQGRMYTMLTFFAAVVMLCVLRMLRARSPIGSSDVLAWAGFVAALPLAMLSHNTAVLLPVAIAAFVGWMAVVRRRAPDGGVGAGFGGVPVRFWITALGAGVFLWLGWLPGFLLQAGRVDADFWIPPPTVAKVLEHFGNLVSADAPGWLTVPILLVGGALAVLGGRALRHRHAHLVLLLALLLVPLAGELLVSVRRPIFYPQTLIWTSLPLTVLVGVGLLRLRPRALLAAGAATLLAVTATSLGRYYAAEGTEDWRGAAGYVASHARPGDVVLFDAGWTQLAFRSYYGRSGGPAVTVAGMPVDPFERGALEPRMTVEDLPRLDALVAGRERVWLVLSHDWYTDPDRLVTGRLGERMRVTDQHDLAGMRIQEYEPR